MQSIPGYVLTTPVCEVCDFILCQATRDLDGLPVLLKVPVTPHPTPVLLHRLEHEYELTRGLDPDRIARPLALEHHADTVALLLERGPTHTLADLLGSPMDIQTFLQFAIGITAALAELHRHELVHKDIKPEHVLLDTTGHVWLTGLGIASRLPRERQTPEPPEVIAGTLAYMAPEQTGRMNRSIDSRSDLYALGITFYQMLTGVLPFTAGDPMEWVHCHIARQPVPPNQRILGLPEPLSEMVMRLLAKTAEERYQSAAGLDADLRRCLAEWKSQGRIDSFPLGEQDVLERLLIPEKLYGRQAEIDTLLAAFNHVLATSMPKIVLVSGYSGIGKTSVVHELHKALVQSRGLFAAGKFDQFKRDIPYATLVQALQTLIRHILGKSETEVAGWRAALQKAVSPNGQLIVSLIPEVELIIGEQPSVPDLPPQEARNRFQMVLRRFLGAFAGPEHPLALFLDDLQWLDAATLDLIEQLVTGQEVRHLLLIGAYRDNEVGTTHPLMRIIDAMRKRGTGLQEIVLAPLAMEDVGNLIADSLHCDRESSLPLAQLVYEKTGGNPYFTIQFLTALAEEKLLAFNAGAGRWAWDLARIHAKGYTDNVVDLMIEKLGRLSAATLEALEQFACMGNVAEIATLSMVCGQSEEALHAALWEAVRAGLVFRVEVAYAFVHDRVQEAAYALVPEGERATAHLRIGRLLLSRTAPEDIEEHSFEIANQFNRAAELISLSDERERIAELNLVAGKRAKRAAAYNSALKYFAAGDALLAEDSWKRQYALTFALESHLAECEFLTGNLDLAEQRISELLQRVVSNIDKAAAYHLRVQLRAVKGEYMHAVDSALMCLRLFGIDFPAHPAWEQVLEEYETVWRNLGGRQIKKLIDLPLMTDPELQAAIDMLSALLPPAYFADMNLFRLAVCRIVNVSILHGASSPSAHGYSGLGVFLGPDFHRYDDGHLFAKLACDLVDKHGFVAHRAQINFSMGMVVYWTQPLANVIDLHRAAIRSALETGAVTFACYSMFHLLAALLLRNDPLEEVWRESEKGLDFVRKAQYVDIADIIVSQQRFIATMQGRTATFSTFSDTQFDEAMFETQLTADRMPTMLWFYWVLKMKARFLSGDYTEALAAADKAKALLWAAAGQTPLLDYYSYAALTVAACCVYASVDEQAGWRDLLKAHQEQLREWAEIYPPTFGDKHALVSAEIAALEGRDADAMRLYERSILSAREYGFVQNEGLALEVAARFYAARGLNTIAKAYLRDAHACYVRWGAQGKVRQLEQRYPQLLEAAAPAPVGTFATEVHDLDILAIIQASQAISGEMVLENLLKTLMRIVLENAGAQKGYLLLIRKAELYLAVDARVEKQNVVMVVHSDPGLPEALFPASILNYVRRSRDKVLLDDATSPNPYSTDEYFTRHHPKSVLCFPITKQTRLIGVLYLENDLATHAFTPDHLAVLELIAAQTAISLENALVYKALGQSEERYRRITEGLTDYQYSVRVENGRPVETTQSPTCAIVTGYTAEELAANPHLWLSMVVPEDRERVRESIQQILAGRDIPPIKHRIRRKDGQTRWVSDAIIPFKDASGNLLSYDGVIKDITERKRADEILIQQKNELTAIFENAPFIMLVLDEERRVRRVNSLACSFTGLSITDMVGIRVGEVLQCLHSLDTPQDCSFRDCEFGPYCQQCVLHQTIMNTYKTGQNHHQVEAILSTLIEGKEQKKIFLISTIRIIVDNSPFVLLSLQDITEHRKLEEQFRQAQKMEAVGTLAGGVAHDFNNMLGVIQGHAELAMEEVDSSQPIFADLQAILQAAERSVNLTRQLLAFARQQTIAPKILDLNETVEGMIKMLRRLIGEDIELSWLPEARVCPVKMDPSQIDQILANLCVNARDAIADVGKVTIETHSVTFDTAFCTDHLGAIPGEYVLLAVSDDGCGMDKEILAKLFEPFFTTKEVGKGTGLGLATVYGIVKQNGGFINVYSEPGQGTTFRIYLPLHTAKPAQAMTSDAMTADARGNETILLVEDEPMILDMTSTMLKQRGYKVLAAATPGDALRLAREHAGEIHLLMTDVVMPEMNGRDLARNLLSLYPNLRCLFMSGYTANVIAHHGVLDEGVHFIQKPFSLGDLGKKVREVME
jgi:PAS domain S-box-containing protein